MTADPVGVASPEGLASLVDRHPDFRVLRRLEPLAGPLLPDAHHLSVVAGCAVDVETTGLDHRCDAVIELAMQRFRADESGRIVDVGPSFRWLADPGRPIPDEIVALTGIDGDAVRGRRICDAEATCLILDADFVVAHNAGFDRPFVEARLPHAAGRPWICSMRDVDWRARGFEGRTLSHLLSQIGWFYDAHRADVDVAALIRLLAHAPDRTSPTVLSEAVATGGRPTWLIEAVGAPFAAKNLLKRRGYRWDAAGRHWFREVAHDAFDEEIEWSVRNVYAGRTKPRFRQMDWTKRYSA